MQGGGSWLAGLAIGGAVIAAAQAAALALALLGWPLLGLLAAFGIGLFGVIRLPRFSLAGLFGLLLLASGAGIGVFVLADVNPLGWPDPRVPVAGHAVRVDLAGSSSLGLRHRRGVTHAAAPILAPGQDAGQPIILWAVRDTGAADSGEAAWRSPASMALRASGDLANAAWPAVQDAARRHRLTIAERPVLLLWTADADARLAAARRALALLLAILCAIWALLWSGDRAWEARRGRLTGAGR
jgi:hypothetical protein